VVVDAPVMLALVAAVVATMEAVVAVVTQVVALAGADLATTVPHV
jgi:hypothetical protein